jgi:phosphatidylethanolamine/phosphatidyl-N-methylethanolamine N-methyltransferase
MRSDFLRFLRTFWQRPKITGAVAPSGKALARAMADQIDVSGRWPVLELGPGTGPVTAALIEAGVAPERIVALEFNPEFCALLVDRFRGLNVVEGDAFDLANSLPPGLAGPYAAVVSSLPLLNWPFEQRVGLISSALDRVVPDGGMIQFSYGFGPPVPAQAGRFAVTRTALVLANLPPARVWRYARS